MVKQSLLPQMILAILGLLGVALSLVALVGGSVVLVIGLSLVPDISAYPLAVFGPAIVISVAVLFVTGMLARHEMATFREDKRSAGQLAEPTHPEIAEMTRKLAQQAGIPTPDVYVTDNSRPESYALGGRKNGEIVVTEGLIHVLSEEEQEAVLAHELSHLVNGDSRIMGIAMVPLLVADQLSPDGPPSSTPPTLFVFSLVRTVIVRLLKLWARLSVALLSRSREFAADEGSARLTGAPASLALAFRTLRDTREPPERDKREWDQTVSALDILPAASDAGWFSTHPDTQKRLERLEALVDETETTE